ncbi:MAG: hypothetical protein MMC33_004926 [Icmadophila ericetorum]|nr:hypothetical protein [Icmadophila ericetorum]
MVVPVEPVSLTIGVVALASLFSTCIECFDYFRAVQALEEDFELLLVKVDVEKTRLLIWGNAVSVLKPEGEGRVPELNNSQKTVLIGRCLERIKSLLSHTDKFQNLYGLQSSADAEKDSRNHHILSINSMSVFWTSYRRFWARFAGDQSRSTLAMRTRWAIHDKANCPCQERDAGSDYIVSILDISKLRLIQSACEGSYTTLSKAASIVIAASEFGTIDRRNIEEWLGDATGMNEDADGDAAAGPERHETLSRGAESLTQGLNINGCIYFILTEQCRKQASQSPCQLSELGKDCAKKDNSILSPKIPKFWSIGKWIADTLDPDKFTSINLDDLMGNSEYQLTEQQKLVLLVAKVCLYCAPCACLLATAFNICEEAGSRVETYFEFLVRPDDRLVSSCCSQKDRTLGLASLIERVREIESSPSLRNYLTSIDRIWVEQRLYEIEEETDLPQPIGKIAKMGGKVLSSHHSQGKTAGIVILGKLGYCLPIMRSPPFALKPRIPKETEIFQMKNILVDGKHQWIRRFLGTYTPKAVPITSPNTPQSAETLPSVPLFSTPVTSIAFLSTSSTPTALSSAQHTSASSLPRQISPPPSPAFKRQKSSPARSVTVEPVSRENIAGEDAIQSQVAEMLYKPTLYPEAESSCHFT